METLTEEPPLVVDAPHIAHCPTCGEGIAIKFCSACGEHCYDRRSFSFHHFLRHSMHLLFEVDSKIWRTLRYLFSKPAFVTSEYLAGRKSRYVEPVRLYMVIFTVLTLLMSPYRSRDDFQTHMRINRTGRHPHILDGIYKSKGISEEVFIEHMIERRHFYNEWLQSLNVLGLACMLAVLYRKRKWYFGEHMVTALYYLSFTSLLSIVKWPFWVAVGAPFVGKKFLTFFLLSMIISLPYLWAMLQRLHGEGKWRTVLKGTLTYGVTLVAVNITDLIGYILAMAHTLLRG